MNEVRGLGERLEGAEKQQFKNVGRLHVVDDATESLLVGDSPSRMCVRRCYISDIHEDERREVEMWGYCGGTIRRWGQRGHDETFHVCGGVEEGEAGG